MRIYVKIMSGKIFTFDLDTFGFIHKIKKIRYLMSREIRQLPQNLIILKNGQIIDDSEILTEDKYDVFVNV